MRFLAQGLVCGAAFIAGCATAVVPTAENPQALAKPTDSLKAVPDPRSRPYESVCRLSTSRRKLLTFRFKVIPIPFYLVRSSYIGTGALVDSSHLITAAHNIHSAWYNVMTGCTAQCGYRNDDSVTWTADFRFNDADDPRGYMLFMGPDFEDDFALVRLRGKSTFTPSFRLARPGDAPISLSDSIFVAGFAADEKANPAHNGDTLFLAKGHPARLAERFICYNFEGSRGMSGAPVWIRRNNENVIVGVHVGAHSCGGNSLVVMGRRVDGPELKEIERWKSPPD